MFRRVEGFGWDERREGQKRQKKNSQFVVNFFFFTLPASALVPLLDVGEKLIIGQWGRCERGSTPP